MKDLEYEITINATPAIVWKAMTTKEIYDQWIKPFSQNSTFDGVWEQGEFIKFLDPSMGGTKAVLEIVVPEKEILAKHVALLSDDMIEDTQTEMAQEWIGSTEHYWLEALDSGTKTKLTIKCNMADKFADMCEECWPKAQEKLKEVCENM